MLKRSIDCSAGTEAAANAHQLAQSGIKSLAILLMPAAPAIFTPPNAVIEISTKNFRHGPIDPAGRLA
jgi:hypothetical protein